MFITAGALAAAVGACQQTARQRYERQMFDTGAPALHAVRSHRLRQAMEELDHLAVDRMPQELDVQERRSREVARLAASLADAADKIPSAASEYGLSEEEQRIFSNLTEKLRYDAHELQSAAERNQPPEQLDNILERLVATCNACHSAFRNLPPVNS